MLFPDLAISDDYQSSNSTKHTLSLTESLNSFYDYSAHISLIFKEKLLLRKKNKNDYLFSGVIHEQKHRLIVCS